MDGCASMQERQSEGGRERGEAGARSGEVQNGSVNQKDAGCRTINDSSFFLSLPVRHKSVVGGDEDCSGCLRAVMQNLSR